jgi:tetratricopeptide (TPR) repeat protein
MRHAAALILLALFAVTTLHAATEAELIAAAKAALDRDDNEKAADLLEQAIKINPRNPETHLMLASAYGDLAQKAGIFKQASLGKKAKAELERTVELDPRNFEARNGLISFYLMAPGIIGGSEEKALEQAAEIRKIDALRGHRAYARVYITQKKPELARKEAVEAVREAPNSAPAHYFLGNMWFNDKNWPNALHEYDYALKLDAAFMPAKFRIGAVAAESGTNQARGEELLKEYLAYKPGDEEPRLVSAWFYLGKLYEKMGRKADAKQAYVNAQKLAPKSKEVAEALKRVS